MVKSRKKSISVFIWLAASFFFGLNAQAQNTIRVVEDTNHSEKVPLKGKAEAVFVSSTDNLFIETSRPSLDSRPKVKKNASGSWEYTIELKLETTEGPARDRTFTITQTGSANKTNFRKGSFEANTRYYFIVETVKNPIYLVDNTQPTDVHLKNGEAAIEINSMMDLSVNVNPSLACQVKRSNTQAGYYSTTIIIDMKSYEMLRNDIQRQQIVYNDLNESLLDRAENGGNVKEEEWDALETMQRQLEEASARFSELSVITVSAEESNDLLISIEDLQVKQKRVYSVELMSNWEGRSNRWRWLLMADYAFSIAPQHSFGITVAQVRKWGWYATFMTNGRFIKTDRTYSNDNTSSSGGDHYLWNGEKSTTRWSATLGGMLALKDFGYVYAGAGYGARKLVWYTQSGLSVGIESNSYQGVVLETGMIINLKDNWPVSFGLSSIGLAKYYEMTIGIGFRF